MKYPILVNVNITYIKGEQRVTDINRAVIDFNYENLLSFMNGGRGNTLIVIKQGDGAFQYDVQLDFDEVYKIYNDQNPIDERFKEEVDSYSRDNLRILKNLDNDTDLSSRN